MGRRGSRAGPSAWTPASSPPFRRPALNDDDEFEWTGEREALLCTGDSLDILTNGDCDVDDGEELLRALCANAGDWFCED